MNSGQRVGQTTTTQTQTIKQPMMLLLYYLVVGLGSKILVPELTDASKLKTKLDPDATIETVYCFNHYADGQQFGIKCLEQNQQGDLVTGYYLLPAQLSTLQEASQREIKLNFPQ